MEQKVETKEAAERRARSSNQGHRKQDGIGKYVLDYDIVIGWSDKPMGKCGICGGGRYTVGDDIRPFLAGSTKRVCRVCTAKYAPPLSALLDLADAARELWYAETAPWDKIDHYLEEIPRRYRPRD